MREGGLGVTRAPRGGLWSGYLDSARELLHSATTQRRLLFALSRRDVSDEYVDHRFSLVWALAMPLFTMAVYLFVFTVVFPARVQAPPAHNTDAIVFLMAGIVPWMALSQALGRATPCIVNNSNIVKQMAFPLELLPLKSLTTPLIFCAVSLAVVVVYAGWVSGGSILLAYLIGLPALLLLSIITFAGLALGLSALQVFFRDTKEFVSMFLSIGLFLHPILYLPNAMPAAIRPFLYASPFSPLIFCWQDVLFYGALHRPWAWVAATAVALVFYLVGARLFMGAKAHFGDFL
jgi:lipopolysaccharide transport system permease protein